MLSIGLACVTGYALALWNVRWAGTFLFVLFMCAFVPFQIIMIPLVVLTAELGIFGTIWAIAVVHAILSMPLLTLIFRNFYKDIPRRDHQRGDHGFGQLLAHLRRDRAADVGQHHDRRADPDDHHASGTTSSSG